MERNRGALHATNVIAFAWAVFVPHALWAAGPEAAAKPADGVRLERGPARASRPRLEAGSIGLDANSRRATASTGLDANSRRATASTGLDANGSRSTASTGLDANGRRATASTGLEPNLRRQLLHALAGMTARAPGVRAEAAKLAGDLHQPLLIDPLRGLLAAPEPTVRRAAAEALGEIGIPRTSEDLAAMTHALVGLASDDADDLAAEGALAALGRFPFPDVRRRLVAIAGDPKARPARREAARRALGRPVDPEALARMSAWLKVSGREADRSKAVPVSPPSDARTPHTSSGFVEPEGVAPVFGPPHASRIAPWATRPQSLPPAAADTSAPAPQKPSLPPPAADASARAPQKPSLPPAAADARAPAPQQPSIPPAAADASAPAPQQPSLPPAAAEFAESPEDRWGLAADELLLGARGLLAPEAPLHLASVQAIGRWDDEHERLPFLRYALLERNPAVRRIAARRLSEGALLASLIALDVASGDPDLEVRKAAIAGFGKMPDQGLARLLSERLRLEPDPTLAIAIRDALMKQPDDFVLDALASWNGVARDPARLAAVQVLSTRTATLASVLLVDHLVRAKDEGVALAAKSALNKRPDRHALPPLLAALDRTPAASTARLRLLDALLGRADPEITRRLSRLIAEGKGDAPVLAVLTSQPDSRAPLLSLLDAEKREIRSLALSGARSLKGPDVIEALSTELKNYPRDQEAFSLLLQQDHDLILEPLLVLLSDKQQSSRHPAILTALEDRTDPRIASPVVEAALATPSLARAAIPVLAHQVTSRAVPALGKLAASKDLDDAARAEALDALAEVGAEDVEPLVRPLALDPALEVRMAARNALHRLEPDTYPKWDPYGRMPLVAEGAAFGAGMMLMASQISQANVSPAFTGIVGGVLGGATPFLLTMNEDVTLGDAGYFGTVALWGTLGGAGIGRAYHLSDREVLWATVGGEVVGLAAGGLTMKRAEWSLDEVLLANFSSVEAGAVSASLTSLLLSRNADRSLVFDAGLIGGTVAAAPLALLSRRLEVEPGLTMIGTMMAHGAWLGLWAPGAFSRSPLTGDQAFTGLAAGQGIGFFTGLALAQFTDLSPRTASYSALGAMTGAAALGGLGLVVDRFSGQTNFALLEAGSLAGALTLGLFANRLEMHHNDPELVALFALGGAVSGGQFSVRLEEGTFGEKSFPGGLLLGLGAGTAGGLIVSQLVDVTDRTLDRTIVGGAMLGAAGIGLGYLAPNLAPRPRSNITGLAFLGGLALTAPFAETLQIDATRLAYASVAGAAGALWGGAAGVYWPAGASSARGEPGDVAGSQTAGGVLFGSALGFSAALAATQAFELRPIDVGVATLGAAAGSAMGAGAGLLVPSLDRRATVGMMQGAGLLGLVGLTAISVSSPPLLGVEGDGLVGLFALEGAWQGALIPHAARSASPSDQEVGGGVLFGTGLGALSGLAMLHLLDLPLEDADMVEVALFGALFNGAGAGVGMLAGEPQLGAGLMEGLGVGGFAAALALAPHTQYGERDVSTFLLGAGLFGGLGAALPYSFHAADPTPEQVRGGALAGTSIGLLSAALFTQLADDRYALELGATSAGGAGIGAGLGLLVPSIDRPTTVAWMEAGATAGLAASLYFAPRTHYDAGGLALIAAASSLGAWHGGWISRSWRSDAVPDRELGGGALLGSSVGLLGGMALAQVLTVDPSDVLATVLLASSVSMSGGGLALSLPDTTPRAEAIALEASGLAGLGAFALLSPALHFKGEDAWWLSAMIAEGAGYGAFLPLLWSEQATDQQRGGGALFGAGIAALAGTLLTRIAPLDAGDRGETLLFSMTGDAIGGGIALLATDATSRTQAALLDGAGLSFFALGVALSPLTSYRPGDATLIMLGGTFGAWEGLWLPGLYRGPNRPLEDREYGGGALAGFGLGALSMGVLSQVTEVSTDAQLDGGLGFLLASAVGAGAGLLQPKADRSLTTGLMEGAGLVGLSSGLLLGDRLSFTGGDTSLVVLGTLVGTGIGLTLPVLLEAGGREDSERDRRQAGGALLGAGVFGIGSAMLAQFTDFDTGALTHVLGATTVGGFMGYGLAMMVPGSTNKLELGLMDGIAFSGAGAAMFYAPKLKLKSDDSATIALGGIIGAFAGGFTPALYSGPSLDGVPSREAAGGVMLGAGVGLGTGLVLTQVTDLSMSDRTYAALGAGLGALSGSGIGLLASRDDRLAVGLMEGLTLAGAVALGATGGDLHYTAGDVALGTAYVGYLTWHSLGLTLLLEGTDRQAAGATMMTLGAGTLTGMYLARHIHLETANVLMLFAGSVWGTWIGGWGGAILRSHIDPIEGRKSAGLTLLSSVVGSDVGLTVTGLVIGGLLDVKPVRFAVINLSGLGGMMIGMLAAGFARGEPLREGNVIGSLAGLVLGTVVTSFLDLDRGPTWEELLQSGENTPAGQTSEIPGPSAGNPIAITSWFPSAKVVPGLNGEQQYLFTVAGTWR